VSKSNLNLFIGTSCALKIVNNKINLKKLWPFEIEGAKKFNTWHMVIILVKCGIGISFGILLSMKDVFFKKINKLQFLWTHSLVKTKVHIPFHAKEYNVQHYSLGSRNNFLAFL